VDLNIKKVAIIDDDDMEIEIAKMYLAELDLEPVILEGPFDSVDILANLIKETADAALCDHRLITNAYANFSGASLVAKLYELKIPAVLITQFYDMDTDSSIRQWREFIPVLLSRDEASSEKYFESFLACYNELEKRRPPSRQYRRAILKIVGLSGSGNDTVVDAIIPGWNMKHAVRFPISLISKELVPFLKVDQRFLAKMNIGTTNPDELFFSDFEKAPEPEDTDGFA